MKKYVDLHMHTTNSDGACDMNELIEKAKELGLKAISITDHDTTKGYKNYDINNRGIKIIKGVEIVTTAAHCPVEVLCYGYDEDKMQEFLNKYSLNHMQESKAKVNKELEVLKNMGFNLKLNTNNYDYDSVGAWLVRDMWNEIISIPQLKSILYNENPDLLESAKMFFRKGMCNIHSRFFVDLTQVYVTMAQLRKFCDDNSTIMILAHPGEYYDNMDIVLDYAKNYVDGIETFHPSIDKVLHKKLSQFCKQYNLLESGGSDYHNDKRGNLNSEKVPYSIYAKLEKKLASMQSHKSRQDIV